MKSEAIRYFVWLLQCQKRNLRDDNHARYQRKKGSILDSANNEEKDIFLYSDESSCHTNIQVYFTCIPPDVIFSCSIILYAI